MNKSVKIIKLILLILSFLSLYVFIDVETYSLMWKISWLFLIIVMIIRPLKDIFPKCRLFSFLLKFRRELAIIVWNYWVAHWVWAILSYYNLIWWEKTYLQIIFDGYTWNPAWYMFWWMLSIIVCIPLLLTSNAFSTKKMWKYWKNLQRLAYLMFVLVWIHIYVFNKEIWTLITLWIWGVLFIIAFIKNKNALKNSSSPKWLCVPCGYIYDETIWDIDSGIAPWTRFEDIPDDWVCPVYFVGKKDFILITWEIKTNDTKVVWVEKLTHDVIELKLAYKETLNFIPGQFVTFNLKDNEGNFSRSYSIAEKSGKILTFLIKLKSDGRAWKVLKNIKALDKINTNPIIWSFNLLKTPNPKVFISTWTWLAPIYAMLLKTPSDIPKKLYFWVAYEKDLFYIENLKQFQNLEIKLYVSREEVKWCINSRINLENESFLPDTEFYMCWSSALVEDTKAILSKKWFTKVFSEEF